LLSVTFNSNWYTPSVKLFAVAEAELPLLIASLAGPDIFAH
jgi:hypothetical protein